MIFNKWICLGIVSIFFIILPGCVNTAVSGAQAVYNRQNIQNSMTDQYITMKAMRAIYEAPNRFKNGSISVATFNRVVLITGQVPTSWQRQAVDKIVKDIPEVDNVYNELMISQVSSVLTDASDAWITAKIKSQFIASESIDPSKVKVVTENGTVYLMGMLLPSQANDAIEIARTTTGVQNVVKVFTYLKISKTM